MSTLKHFRNSLLGATCVFLLATASHAADVVAADAPLESGFNWSGIYVGFGVGAGANVHEVSSQLLPGFSLDGIGGEGAFGELTVGYDHMVAPRFLIGAFADAHYGNIETSLEIPLGGLGVSASDTYGFDVGARAGYLFTPTTLGYVVGGYAWQKAELEVSGLVSGELDWDRDGYFVGAGVETVITGNWTLKTEYRFTQFGTTNILEDLDAPDGLLDTDTSRHTFHVAANYRFGAQDGGGAAFAAPVYNWTGFYIGGALGAGAVVHDISLGGVVDFNGLGGEGVFGELNAGYDQDFGSFVAGVMVDGRYSGISTDIATVAIDADYGFDVLARLGMKLNESTLAYVIGGYSWQNFEFDIPDGGGIDDIEWDSSGFSVGGGLEAAVTENVAVNLEYRYSQFDSEDFDTAGFIELEPSFHTVRIGAKYKFN